MLDPAYTTPVVLCLVCHLTPCPAWLPYCLPCSRAAVRSTRMKE